MKKEIILFGLLIALLLAVFLSPFASEHPDGLEKVAEDKQFISTAEGKEIIQSPIPDYTFPGIKNERIATAIAGLSGTLITFILVYFCGYLLKKKRKSI